jgi:hypothetical protein
MTKDIKHSGCSGFDFLEVKGRCHYIYEQRDIGACLGGIFVHDRKKTLILIGKAGW